MKQKIKDKWSSVKDRLKDFEIEDLYQIGCMGFIKSIKRFDLSSSVPRI